MIHIIGAGLTGLTAAYELTKRGLSVHVLEADNHPGGRIDTFYDEQGAALEMGATWFGDKHAHLNALLEELGVERFEQYAKGRGLYEVMSFLPPQNFQLPYDQDPYYRIAGGSRTLIDRLVEKIGTDNISLNTTVTGIVDRGDSLSLQIEGAADVKAERAILAVAPRLAAMKFHFEPMLPKTWIDTALQTPTWMGQSIKVVITYERPFWRIQGYAGMAVSQVGIVQEIHDHTDREEQAFALMGFLSDRAHQFEPREREAQVIRHLAALFGERALNYRKYIEKDWRMTHYTSTTGEGQLFFKAHYGDPKLRSAHWNGKLFLSSTETAAVFPGYMEGAVYAGKTVVDGLTS